MIKVSDFIANYLVEQEIQHVFMVTGGGAMHLNNSLGKHKNLEVVFNHHEQACAMAAESYARLTNKPAVVNVTSGPGGINALNGVFGAWTDSIPMLVLSGQVRYDTTVQGVGLPLRQMGDQEYDIVRSVKPMTKYAVMITDPKEIRYELQKALYIATKGRPGPVWLDIPLNIQGAMVDEAQLREYNFPAAEQQQPPHIEAAVLQAVLTKIRSAERPVLMVGTGVRLSGAYYDFLKAIDALKIPVVTAFNAHDLLPENHPLYVGRPGTVGDRPGNFAVQNADVLIVLGCRLNIRQIGYNWKSFARAAYKIVVDIDALELKKPTTTIDMPIHGDAADFFKQLLPLLEKQPMPAKPAWLAWCKERKEKYPVVLRSYWERSDAVNPYCFIEVLNDHLDEGQIIVTANATACITAFQALKIKRNQRLYSNSGSASMGYDLPAAIGACFGAERKKIICLAGDGSLQMNLQELATIRYYQLPIKIFVLNNSGYHSIRQTQENFFGKPLVGVSQDSGLFFPSMEKIAHAYEMQYTQAETHDELNNSIAFALVSNKPAICEIMITTEQPFAPKMSSKRLEDGRMVSKPLEDLAPFLDREELMTNMLIDLLPEES
jgi:acetolactate synthase-1/2/3 large subunit